MLPKSPEDMSLDELKLLLEIRKLELKNSLQDVKHKLGIGARILKAIQKSGIIEQISEHFSLPKKNPPPHHPSSANSPEAFHEASTDNQNSDNSKPLS